jgi:DNA-binding GntR family transcriptional regulator
MLRDAIVSGELLPGEQIGQQMWADRARVSRPPMREALEILANEGLIIHQLHRGYFVAKLSRDELDQIYTMRRMLERQVLETVEWPTKSQLAMLRRQAEMTDKAGQAGRLDSFLRELQRFQFAIYDLSPRKLIIEEVRRLWYRSAAYRALAFESLGLMPTGLLALDQVLEALEAHDRERMMEFMLKGTEAAYPAARLLDGRTAPAVSPTG